MIRWIVGSAAINDEIATITFDVTENNHTNGSKEHIEYLASETTSCTVFSSNVGKLRPGSIRVRLSLPSDG